jgi:SAM-dependent methyltransferase
MISAMSAETGLPRIDNLQRFDSVADHGEFDDVALKPAEHNALVLMADRIGEIEMLDLGIGGGRTGYTFAPLVRRYIGLDFSPRMIERARGLLGEEDSVSLVVGDARDLSSLREDPDFDGFDFVLFSFNGLGAVGHEDRLKVLDQVRSLIKPDGRFQFSSHSTGALPLTEERPVPAHLAGSRAQKLLSPLANRRYARQARASNARLDLDEVRERGWAIVRDPAFDFGLDVYYVDAEFQVEQLREHGFEVEKIWDMRGREVALPYRGRDVWLDYYCRPI